MHVDNLISCESLAANLQHLELRIVDCRFHLADTESGERAYHESHLPGAVYAHLDRDLSSPIGPLDGRHPLPDVDQFVSWLGRVGIGNDSQVVVYDDCGGSMAVRLWWMLRWLGHERVALLDGGWQAWTARGLPLSSSPSSVPATTFRGAENPQMVVTTEGLQSQLGAIGRQLLLIDVRAPERFRGEQEPVDPVAGHVPGAINLPLQHNLDSNGCFLNAEQLGALYAPTLKDHAPSDLVAMCGSGVTACHTLLALEIAGIHGGRLYVGSWSEWIRDPARPIATGD